MGPIKEDRISEFVSGGNLVLFNGRIHTLEKCVPEIEAVVIRDGRLTFLGSSREALAFADSSPTIDLEGRFALPGFIDSHVHFWRSGLMDQMVDLRRARRIAEIQELIREAAKAVPSSGLVMGRGWADTELAEQRYPTRSELDQAAPDHPVLLGVPARLRRRDAQLPADLQHRSALPHALRHLRDSRARGGDRLRDHRADVLLHTGDWALNIENGSAHG